MYIKSKINIILHAFERRLHTPMKAFNASWYKKLSTKKIHLNTTVLIPRCECILKYDSICNRVSCSIKAIYMIAFVQQFFTLISHFCIKSHQQSCIRLYSDSSIRKCAPCYFVSWNFHIKLEIFLRLLNCGSKFVLKSLLSRLFYGKYILNK